MRGVLQLIDANFDDVYFISDLHLSVETPALNETFFIFLTEYASKARALFILGDLFADWIGDDAMDSFHDLVASKIFQLKKQGVIVYFMPGNRDFLLGARFFNASGMVQLNDPALIRLGEQKVLLKHGDDLCLEDKSYQRFRSLVRKSWIQYLFLKCPLSLRQALVGQLKQQSHKKTISIEKMQVVDGEIVKNLSKNGANILICGHTHQPMIKYLHKAGKYQYVILPDWGNKYGFLYYNSTQGFRLIYQNRT